LERRARARHALASEHEPKERKPFLVRPRKKTDPWVDLLHHDPIVTADIDLLRPALRFAFESGDAGGMLARAVDEAPTAPSTWNPSSFASSLFLPQLLEACFPISVGNKSFTPSQSRLVRLLEHPPTDLRDVTLRQGVLRELGDRPELRESLSRIYATLRQLRSLLDEQPIAPDETVRRKIDVLTTIKAYLDEADDGLKGARSALSRVHDHAHTVRESVSYTHLAQLLDFDDHLATVDVRIVLGSDGRIRHFNMLQARENTGNPHVHSPWRRFWSRLIALFRGYRYSEDFVLLRVIDSVFDELEDVIIACVGLVGDIEFYLASLGFKDRAERDGLAVSLCELAPAPSLEADAGPFELRGLFNPLLLLQGITPKACDVAREGHDWMALITGPNSGGKTRLLQAIALAQLLGQSGLFVPASRARLTAAPTLFVSLVEGAPADEKEGRLGSELMRVRTLFEQLEPGTLVILDELCSGTNPSEGIAIFELVLSLLPRLRPQVFVTTHFLDAARALERDPSIARLAFLQVELDADDQPTYQFVSGVAPTSLAHQVASRLGVTREELERIVTEREARLRSP
jgi:DNA mismatch repair protein MutS2